MDREVPPGDSYFSYYETWRKSLSRVPPAHLVDTLALLLVRMTMRKDYRVVETEKLSKANADLIAEIERHGSKPQWRWVDDLELQFLDSFRAHAAKKGGDARHAKDPKQAAKAEAKTCWLSWVLNPSAYPSQSAFARDMLEKFEDLGSQSVVEGWSREWAKERGIRFTRNGPQGFACWVDN